jgi:hypothetical protein
MSVKRGLVSVLAASLALTTRASLAEESQPAPSAQPSGEAPPSGQAPSSGEAPPAQSAPSDSEYRRHFAGRIGAAGTYRGIYDLSVLGGGVELSLGSESGRTGHHGGYANLHFFDARSIHGLPVLEVGVTCTLEWLLGGGWRLGAGAGLTFLTMQRATGGNALQHIGPSIQSLGPVALGRAGYDFGRNALGAYVLLDFEVLLQSASPLVVVWGPTMQVGMRF